MESAPGDYAAEAASYAGSYDPTSAAAPSSEALPASAPMTKVSANPLIAAADQVAAALGVNVFVVFVAASSLVALVLYRVIFRRVLAAAGGGVGRVHRHTVLLVGLPSSGKTVLLQQLQRFDVNTGRPKPTVRLADTRTSMQPNVEKILEGQLTVVDYPGHRRLRTGLPAYLREAATLVVVIDAITVHDDKHEGAFAVAELLLSLLPSPEFYGVKGLLFVCAKRDDVTAYSAKAVRKLLEKAMAASLQSQQGDLARVDAVVDAKGGIVGRSNVKGKRGRGGKAYVLELDENGTFDFEEQLGIPVAFVEVGCDVASGGQADVDERLSVKSVIDFITSSA